MFPMGLGSWAWDWGWGWAATVGGIIVLGILLIPWFLFLLNLQTTLNRVSVQNRAMPAGHVWLNFIPVFNLGWFIYTATKVRDSVRAEYQSRGWPPDGDFGYNVGLTTGILAIASFFIGWVPVVGWGIGLALLVCWIIYWLKTSDLKNRLGSGDRWQGFAPYSPYSQPPYKTPQAAWPPPARPVAPGTSASGTSASGAPVAAPPATTPAASPEGESPAQPPTADEVGAKLCAGCGAPFDPADRFCRSCGLRLP